MNAIWDGAMAKMSRMTDWRSWGSNPTPLVVYLLLAVVKEMVCSQPGLSNVNKMYDIYFSSNN